MEENDKKNKKAFDDKKIESEVKKIMDLNIESADVGSQIKEMSKELRGAIGNNNEKIEEASRRKAINDAKVMGKWKEDVISGEIPMVSIPVFEHLFKLIIKDRDDNVLIPNFYVRKVDFNGDNEMVIDFLFTEEFGPKLLSIVSDKNQKFWIDTVFLSASMDEVFDYKRDQVFKAKKVMLPTLRRSGSTEYRSKEEVLHLTVKFRKPFFERFL